MIHAHFRGIKNVILENINNAKDEIIIAVAWFTHRDLFSAIMMSLEREVDVSILLIRDIINCNVYGLDFNQFIAKGGKLCFVDSRKVLMHNKFCLIDRRTVITGSYNWTYSAEHRNAENVLVTDYSVVCVAYMKHFLEL